MAEGKIDVALVGSRVPESLEESLVATPYATDELVLIVSRQVRPNLGQCLSARRTADGAPLAASPRQLWFWY